MFIPDPDFLSIPDPGSKNSTVTKERVEKFFVILPFFVATKITKLETILIFELAKKKIWANLQRIIELSTQKIVIKLSKIRVWDPGSYRC
jgi:hypothetical protein